jgi:hypothetical protein
MNTWHNHPRIAAIAALVMGTLTWSTNVLAQTTPQLAVQSGGASQEEFDALSAKADDYSLKLLLAAKGSGAYLAYVDVSVRALPSNEVVLEHRTEGPLMLADLPPGRYRVEAQYTDVLPGAPSVLRRDIVVPRVGSRELVLYFDTGDKVGS